MIPSRVPPFMRKCSWTLIVCLTVLFAVTPVRAQTPSPDAMVAARELIVTMHAVDYFKATMPALMKAMKPAIAQNRPEVERDYGAMVPLLLEGMNTQMNDLIEQVAVLYAKNFTADELREAVAFYRGPTGQKIVQKVPAITQESILIGQRWGQSIGGELRGRMIDELRKRGHNI